MRQRDAKFVPQTLGVIGLGAIGALIANAAVSLGMTVCGTFTGTGGWQRLFEGS